VLRVREQVGGAIRGQQGTMLASFDPLTQEMERGRAFSRARCTCEQVNAGGKYSAQYVVQRRCRRASHRRVSLRARAINSRAAQYPVRAPPFIIGLLLTSQLQAQRTQYWGFTGPWDARSHASVRAHGARLEAVVSGWIALDSVTGQPLLPSAFPDTVRAGGRAQRMAIVTSWHGDRFHARSVRALGRDRLALARAASAIAREAQARRYTGLVFNFEELSAADLAVQRAVTRTIADSARAHGVRTIAIAIPAGDMAAYPAKPLLEIADLIMPMMLDEHWGSGTPGAIASLDWMRRTLAARVTEAGGADRIVAVLPLYGYRWIRGKPTEELTFGDARRVAATTGKKLSRDPVSRSLHASGAGWELWVSDAVALRELVRAGEQLGVRRFALWRLGQEDSAVWKSLVPPR